MLALLLGILLAYGAMWLSAIGISTLLRQLKALGHVPGAFFASAISLH